MKFRLFGKTWRLFFVHEVDREGCLGETDDERHQCLVLDSLRGRLRLDVIIHEMLHAGNMKAKEKWVEETARTIARTLWDLGYRNLTEHGVGGPSAPQK
jgi:hypothetical protein